MKFTRGITFCLAALIAPLASAQTDSFGVLQTNIDRDIGPNGPNSSGQSALAQEINYLDPDVWNMQELGGNNSGWTAAGALTSLTTFVKNDLTIFGSNPVLGTNYFVYVGTYTDGYIGNAIVSRYPIVSTASYNDGLRGLTEATISLPNGANFGDFTTHEKATTDSADVVSDSEKRQSESDTDKANMQSWMNANPASAAVFTADMNEDEDPADKGNYPAGSVLPNGETYRPISTILSAGFNDGVPLAVNGYKQTIDSGVTMPNARFDYNFRSNQGGISYQSGLVFNSLDYTSAQLAAMNAARGTALVAATSQDASDHLPVIVSYSIAPAPEPATVVAFVGLAALAIRRRRVKMA